MSASNRVFAVIAKLPLPVVVAIALAYSVAITRLTRSRTGGLIEAGIGALTIVSAQIALRRRSSGRRS